MMLRKSVLIILLIGYGLLFFYQEQYAAQSVEILEYPLPGIVQKTVLGYLRQIWAEMHFIKTAVFLGGNFTNNPDETYSNTLAKNFEVMAELHPHFIDIYFLCESSLPHNGPRWTRAANDVLKMGMDAHPERWELPFFQGFNYNHLLKEPVQAAKMLMIAAKKPGAPDWLEHLASLRAAQGGDILSGLVMLKAMLESEKDPVIQKRYEKDIMHFEQALKVQKGIYTYFKKYNVSPKVLSDLVPEFLPELPDFDGTFYLEWVPPDLRLKRPTRKIQH
jgi:hypothetical protein